jgi:hypothetical protein
LTQITEIVVFKVVWTSQPSGQLLREEVFNRLEDAREEADLFSLAIVGTIKHAIYDEDGRRLEVGIHDNA